MRLALVLVVATFAGVAAAAPTKRQCVDADTWGQSERQQDKLHAARADFRICVEEACPAIVRSDCRMRLEEVDRVMPTIVIEAPLDLSTASVTMDGAPLAVGASPIEVDPGRHHFELRLHGHAPVQRDVDVSEEDRSRRVVFDRPTAEVHLVAPRPSGMGPVRVAGIVTGAVGLVGIVLGAAFGAATFGAWATVESECFGAAPCDVARALADHQRAVDFATASDVAFIAGGVLAAAGVALFVFGGNVHPTAARDTVGLLFTRSF